MTYYLVVSGFHSDQMIVALFSKAVPAQALADHLDEGGVIPLPLDLYASLVCGGKFPYEVSLHADGSLDCCSPTDGQVLQEHCRAKLMTNDAIHAIHDDDADQWIRFIFLPSTTPPTLLGIGTDQGAGYTQVWADTPEQAVEIAQKRRIRDLPQHHRSAP